MRHGSLARLVAAARRLPGEISPSSRTWPVRRNARTDGAAPAPDEPAALDSPAALRPAVGALLRELATRLAPALSGALLRGARAWDQADMKAVIDHALVQRIDRIRRAAERLQGEGDPGVAAAGLEAGLTVAAAVDLVALFERRLATLARLQLRGGGALDEGGRPFLDLPAALIDAARGWA